MQIICTDCGHEFKVLRAGVLVKELFEKNTEIYRIWTADILGCPICSKEVVARFGDKPIAEHWNKEKMQDALLQCETRIPGVDLFEWKELFISKQGDYLPKFLRRKDGQKKRPGSCPDFEIVTHGDPRKI